MIPDVWLSRMYPKIVDGLLVTACLLIYCLPSCESLTHSMVHAAVGQKASLPCSVDIIGNIHVEWQDPQGTMLTFNEEVLTQDQRFSIRHPYMKEWYLDIGNVRNTDAGNYTCRIGPVPEISRFVELVVTRPPEITRRFVEDSYLVNSTVTMTCEAKGVPQPKITWHRRNEHSGVIELKGEGNIHVIESVDWSKAGVYECHARNDVPPMAKEFLQVRVLFAPIVRVPYREVIQEEGRWTQLTCLIIANPSPVVYWMRNDVRIQDSANVRVHRHDNFSSLYHIALRLTLEELSASDYGHYKCYAENGYGKDHGVINLRGHDNNRKPLLTSAPKDTLSAVGEDTLMNCSIVNLPRGHSVIWWHTTSSNETRKLFESQPVTKNRNKMADNSNSNIDRTIAVYDAVKYDIAGQYNLIIRKTNFSDQGVYACQITGHDNHSAILKVIANRDPSAICNGQKQPMTSMNTTLIILAVVVFIVLVIVIIVVVLVYKLLLKRASQNSVELSSKVNKLDQL